MHFSVSEAVSFFGTQRAEGGREEGEVLCVSDLCLIMFLGGVKPMLEGFISTYPYFENSAEEFYPHETLSIPIELLSCLSSLRQCHVSIFNAHETL